MSLVKSSPAYARHMDELFMEQRERIEESERFALMEREYLYLTATNTNNNKPKNNDHVDQRTDR